MGCGTTRGLPKGWFPKGWFWQMFPRNEKRNEGTFGCSPGTKTGTRVRSHVPPERNRNEGYARQNHPFTKPLFYLGTEKVPQRNCVTKASKPLFYWVITGNPLEWSRKFFGAVRAIFWFCGSFLAPDLSPSEQQHIEAAERSVSE